MLTLSILATIPDHRRGQGRLFDLPHVLLCGILAVLAGADTYRSAYRFIDTRWEWLRQHTGLSWRRKPCYTALYTILRGIDAAVVEQALRRGAAQRIQQGNERGVENRCHHIRDVSLHEDASRIRMNPGIFAQRRTWALNGLRHAKHTNIKAARDVLGWDTGQLLNLFSCE